jgi:SPP1 gp7 family putative phage head morphogenesis protein
MATKQLDEFARTWIAERSLTLAKSINKTTLEALRRELSLGFEAGESHASIISRLENYFTGNAKARAELIARTETIAAYNEGNLHKLETSGVDKSEFYASPDACVECLDLVGEYPTKEVHGMIPVHPNCRCRFFGVY